MKPAPFRYVAARSLEQALALKAEHGDEARFLAGGQSLVPAMNFRLVQAALLVDLNGLAELDFIRLDDGGELRLGAMRMSSMTQDVVLRGAQDTELESITGYIVRLAAEHGVAVPYNRAIYWLGREKFHPGFEPLSPEQVLATVEEERAKL